MSDVEESLVARVSTAIQNCTYGYDDSEGTAKAALEELGLLGKGRQVKANPAFSVRTECENCAQELEWRALAEVPHWEHRTTYSIDCDEVDITERATSGAWWDR